MITFTIEFEVETHDKTADPLVSVCNQDFSLSNGIAKIEFDCTNKDGFTIVWKNKTKTYYLLFC